jgi:hypothetical protein
MTVSRLKYLRPAWPGHGSARHSTVRIGYFVNWLGPQLELGVQLLTLNVALPYATDRQLVHFMLAMKEFDGMQPGKSSVAGRTVPWSPQ